MELKLNIPGAIARKAFCIILVLLISLNFLVGGALANNCHGGADCLICAGSMHPQLPETEMGMASDGCQPVAQNSSCGFEGSPGPNKFFGIIPAVIPDNNEAGGIFNDVSADGSVHVTGEFLPQTIISGTGRSTSIYLINNSLLC
jgi:hypothetical protein